MQVQAFVDPACGWSQVAVGWLHEVVAAGRSVEVVLSPFSLLLRDGVDGRPPAQVARRTAAHRALRVMARLAGEGGVEVGAAFWHAVVAQDGPAPFRDLAAAVEAAGADRRVARAADDESLDETIRRSMARASGTAGSEDVPIPGLLFDDTVFFTGPLLRSVPRGPDACALFDAVLVMARTPGFYELSRPRPSHPELAGLPAPPHPPRLAPARPPS